MAAPDIDTEMANNLLMTFSSKSSVSMNTLLSDYLSELQQLAEGTLLQTNTLSSGPGENKEATPPLADPDMLMPSIESFPISSCNSWGLPVLAMDHRSMQAAEDWITKIARPPEARQDAGAATTAAAASTAAAAAPRGPSILSQKARAVPPPFQAIPEADDAKQEPSPPPSFLSSLLSGHGQPQTGAPPAQPEFTRPLLLRSPVFAPAPPAPAAPLAKMPELPSSSVEASPSPGAARPAGQGVGRLSQQRWLPWSSPRTAARERQATQSSSGGLASPRADPDSAGDGQEQESQRGKGGKRSKEEVQKRNKEAQQRFRDRQKAKLKELEDKVEELNARLDAADRDRCVLELRLAEFASTLAERDELIARLRADAATRQGSTEGPAAAARYTCNLVLTVYEGRQIRLTTEDISRLTRVDMVTLWKEYVAALSNLLPSGDVEPATAAAEQIQRLINEATALLLCVADGSPAMFKTVAACKLEPIAGEHGNDSLRLWTAVTEKLGLSGAQRADLTRLRGVCLATLASIMEERNAIHALLTAHEGIEQLKLNLKREHDLKVDWMTAICAHVLTPVQVARVIVHSYPWLPDTMAVAAVVAAQGGDPAALSHLRADDSGGPGAFVQPQAAQQPGCGGGAPLPLGPDSLARGSSHKKMTVPTPFAAQDGPSGGGGSTITSGNDY